MTAAYGPMTAKIVRFPRAPTRSQAELELIRRKACSEFLYACFQGATKSTIKHLAADVYRARDAMREG